MFVFLCQDLAPIEIGRLPNGEPDLVFRGFYVTNSETGAGSLRIGVMYLRGVCCNRILWGVENFEEITMRHSKYAPERFLEECRPALESFSNGSALTFQRGVEMAREAKVAKDKDEALVWLQAREVGKKRSMDIFDAIMKEERGGDESDTRPFSAWDMAQGITAVARLEPNHDTRFDLELIAGKVLDKVA